MLMFIRSSVMSVRHVCVVMIALLLSASAVGQDHRAAPVLSDQGGAIPVRVVDGRIVFSCDIAGPSRRLPVNLWLDLDGAYGLQLHNRAAAPLPAETGGGQALPLTLYFPDFTLTVPRRELGDEEAFEAFTKYHSAEIGENALVGALGAHYLKHFDVVLDLSRNRVELHPPGGLAGRSPIESDTEVIVPISERNDLVWLPVALGEQDLAMAVGSINYDTQVDLTWCETLGRPGGDVGSLRCRTIDLSKFVAFRPEPINLVHPDGVAGVMGINLLESMRIHIDRESRLAHLTMQRRPQLPQADLEFFQARAAENAAQVEAWLEKYPQERLNREAAELLLTYFLEEDAGAEATGRALKWIRDTTVEGLRATRMLDLMEELSNEGEMDLVIAAGELGVESGRKDRYPDAVHKIHGRLGEIMLDRDEDREAWRHLLSAAFGLPEDGLINLNLGRCYEKTGRFRRAFSRYVQAVIKEESGPMAMEGMRRIDEQLPPEERLSIDLIDRMISGKVRNFGAPVKFERTVEDGVIPRTVLVEFFTNAHVGNERRGAIGGALGNQGLLTHFEPDDCVFLSYHLPEPRMEPLVNALAIETSRMLGVGGPVVQVIDGGALAPGAGRWGDAEAIYNAARAPIVSRLDKHAQFKLKGEARIENGYVRGAVHVEGSLASDDLRVQVIVAERGVVFPGKSTVVIHRMLARGSAFGSLEGRPLDSAKDLEEFQFERSLAELERELVAFLEEMEAGGGAASRMGTRIDPRSVVLVALVRDIRTGEVHQALQIMPKRIDAANDGGEG